MPQATPTRTTDRDRLRSRPSVNTQSLTVDNAPVLFRLPVVGAMPRAQASNPAANSGSRIPDQAPPYRDQPVTGAAGAASATAGAAGTGNAVSLAGTGNALGAAGTGNAVVGAAGTGIAETAPLSSTPPINAERSQPPQASTVSPSVSPSARTSEPEAELAGGAKATWWEHWSSGVVLILLIIALVTASILALNDGRKSPADQLAGEPVAALDEFDLSNITIPEVVSGTIPNSAQTSLSTHTTPTTHTTDSTQTSEATQTKHSPETTLGTKPSQSNTAADLELAAASTAQSPAPADSAASLPTPAVPALAVPALALPATTSEANNSSPEKLATTAQASLSPPANANLTPNTPDQSAGSMLETSDAPLASLTAPEPVSPAPLFDPKTTQQLSSQLPPLPTFNPSGPTPAPYDGAALNNELHAANQEPATSPIALPNSMPQMSPRSSSMPGMLTSAAPIETDLPSFATVLTSAAQAAQPMTNSEVQPTNSPKPIPSATPDSDAAALAQAYLLFSEINKASNGVSTNRWSTPTTTSPPAMGSSAPTGGMGFTLGNQPAQ